MTTTYDELQEAWKRDFHNSDLQPLRPGLFKELSSYIKRLREAQRNLDAKSLKAIVIEEEMLRLDQLLTQFLDRRLSKLWHQARLVQSTNLEYTEKLTHQAISEILRDYDKMKQDLMQGQEPSRSRSKDGEFVMIRFVKDVPSIIGVDLKAHGPFHKEDVARLPQENAESLIRQGAAVQITTSNRDNE
jgi:DNA replication factor GINS